MPFFLNFASVIELSRHIEILLLDNDCVIVPGFGGFMAHYVSAIYDQTDGTFLPPKRTVGFNPKLTINDSLLTQSYVEAYDISYPDACKRIEEEVRELKGHLENEGYYELTDIGTLRVNSDGHYEFSPCEAGILTPSLYGLGSFEMKALAPAAKETEESDTATMPAAAMPEIQSADGEEKLGGKRVKQDARLIALWRNVAVACIALIVFLLLPTRLSNGQGVIESRVNTDLLQPVLPQQKTFGEKSVGETVKNANVKALIQKAKQDSAAQKTKAEQAVEAGYTIVLASQVSRVNAEAYVQKLHKRGLDSAKVLVLRGRRKVVYGMYPSAHEAQKIRNKLANYDEFAQGWVMEVKQ